MKKVKLILSAFMITLAFSACFLTGGGQSLAVEALSETPDWITYTYVHLTDHKYFVPDNAKLPSGVDFTFSHGSGTIGVAQYLNEEFIKIDIIDSAGNTHRLTPIATFNSPSTVTIYNATTFKATNNFNSTFDTSYMSIINHNVRINQSDPPIGPGISWTDEKVAYGKIIIRYKPAGSNGDFWNNSLSYNYLPGTLDTYNKMVPNPLIINNAFRTINYEWQYIVMYRLREKSGFLLYDDTSYVGIYSFTDIRTA